MHCLATHETRYFTDRKTCRRHYDDNSRSNCVAVRSANDSNNIVANLLWLTVDRPDTAACKTHGRITVHGSSGYLSNLANPTDSTTPPPSSVEPGSALPVPGSDSCPWTIVVRPGQTVALRVIVLPFDGDGKRSGGPPRRASDYNPTGIGYGCAASFVIREPPLPSSEDSHPDDVDAADRRRRHHYSVCARNSRERHLYTSAGNAVSVHVTSTRFAGPSHVNRVPASRRFVPRFIINYEGTIKLTTTTTNVDDNKHLLVFGAKNLLILLIY